MLMVVEGYVDPSWPGFIQALLKQESLPIEHLAHPFRFEKCHQIPQQRACTNLCSTDRTYGTYFPILVATVSYHIFEVCSPDRLKKKKKASHFKCAFL